MRHASIQSLIAQSFKANGFTIMVINQKENKNPLKCTKIKQSQTFYEVS